MAEDDITALRDAMRRLAASLEDTIEMAFHAHKLAKRAFAASQGRKLEPLADQRIENTKRELLKLLRKANSEFR